MSDKEKHDWDRQPRETSRSYELFCVYRNLGPERSLAKARESANGIPSVARLKVLSRKWNWVERCQEYDDHLEYQDRLQQEKERREMHKRHAKIAILGLNVAVKGIEKLLANVQTSQQNLGPSELARLVDVSVKVERLARGEPTDSHELSGPNAGPVKLDLAQTLKRIDEVYGLKSDDDTGKPNNPGDRSGASES